MSFDHINHNIFYCSTSPIQVKQQIEHSRNNHEYLYLQYDNLLFPYMN